jgi:hypothetical protein
MISFRPARLAYQSVVDVDAQASPQALLALAAYLLSRTFRIAIFSLLLILSSCSRSCSGDTYPDDGVVLADYLKEQLTWPRTEDILLTTIPIVLAVLALSWLFGRIAYLKSARTPGTSTSYITRALCYSSKRAVRYCDAACGSRVLRLGRLERPFRGNARVRVCSSTGVLCRPDPGDLLAVLHVLSLSAACLHTSSRPELSKEEIPIRASRDGVDRRYIAALYDFRRCIPGCAERPISDGTTCHSRRTTEHRLGHTGRNCRRCHSHSKQ